MFAPNRLDNEASRRQADREAYRAQVLEIASQVSDLTINAKPKPANVRMINGEAYTLCPVTKNWVRA